MMRWTNGCFEERGSLSGSTIADGGDCFLCNPRPELVYASVDESLALCGLGPLGPAYSIIATKAHVRSAADAYNTVSGFIDFTNDVRAILDGLFGSSVLTEHGRLGACVGPSGASDPHCFHAHFLLFPGVPNIVENARSYFAEDRLSSTLSNAMQIANESPDEYFLVSGSVDSFHIMTRPSELIRQFARWLVAGALNTPEKANWQEFPDEQNALRCAQDLREVFKKQSLRGLNG
jgi:hypothetical protein